ncbi:MAG: ATP-binding cassette domain-containing protein, partial [Spirochaetaceae bacterium]|nr:ATP-binding cassette domain-containing protein [Spirochaetaceae bacterium]
MDCLDLEQITKYYPASNTLANDEAWLHVREGEIHALVGENGAGKTTLMRILYGLEKPDSGKISLNAREIQIKSPLDAARFSIGMVHQHFMTVDDFTVAENVVLGAEPLRGRFFYASRQAEDSVRATMKQHDFSVDPARLAGSLTVGERQQLEIIKLLYREAQFLIL